MNKDIYVVTDGEYSDYRILGVFSTKEKAQNFIDLCGGIIEEYDLDEAPGIPNYKEGYSPYELKYNIANNSFEVEKMKWSTHDNDPDYCMPYGDNKSWAIHCIAKDEKHALKISNERIMQIKALNLINITWEEYREIKSINSHI